MSARGVLELSFRNEVWYWRGPAPFYFVSIPTARCGDVRDVSGEVSYGWGMIPAIVRIGSSSWYSAIWPKDGGYAVPIIAAVRRAEGIDDGSMIDVQLRIAPRDQLTDRPAI